MNKNVHIWSLCTELEEATAYSFSRFPLHSRSFAQIQIPFSRSNTFHVYLNNSLLVIYYLLVARVNFIYSMFGQHLKRFTANKHKFRNLIECQYPRI